MISRPTNAEIRSLKGRAQLMKPLAKIGKQGVSDAFIKSLDEILSSHELVKVKFEEHKDQKKILAPLVAEKTRSSLIMQVGNTFVLYRKHSQPSPD